MDAFLRLLPSVALLATIFGLIGLVVAYRNRAMRALAKRWRMCFLGKQLPKTFSMDRRHFPFHGALKLTRIYNVISGERNGREVVIFDSTFGGSHGYYCTFFAVRAESNPFDFDPTPWKLIQSKGWFALCRTRFLQIPWTMNIKEIENHLELI